MEWGTPFSDKPNLQEANLPISPSPSCICRATQWYGQRAHRQSRAPWPNRCSCYAHKKLIPTGPTAKYWYDCWICSMRIDMRSYEYLKLLIEVPSKGSIDPKFDHWLRFPHTTAFLHRTLELKRSVFHGATRYMHAYDCMCISCINGLMGCCFLLFSHLELRDECPSSSTTL